MLGLLLFVILYVGLASWFTYTAYRMIAGMMVGGEGAVAAFFAALPSAFLAIFMWKAIFFIRRGIDNPGLEITADDQPRLFAFLYELADELNAPRPHRVYISPNVNASVFFDVSILNFILPSKKNLVIGLGLVNVVNRSELKAVLAHEFGHFAQRSMAVGRWVYVGEQIAGHIIAKRDLLDRTLDFISSIDLRVSWIGWIMRTVVWSIRSLMETVFGLVVLSHRALSREMEFQADLVAVSVTGSDALIHALYRLQPADEDWERSLEFANGLLGKEKVVKDLYEVQTRIGVDMRCILNDPMHGMIPVSDSENVAEQRLFTEQIAQPPRMWSTHPPNTEREENAKRIYIPAGIDGESAWTLFENPWRLRESVTGLLFDEVKLEKELTLMSSEEVLAELDEQLSHERFNHCYQGVYYGRSVTIGVVDADQMYAEPPARGDIADSLRQLYPESLQETLTEWRNLEEEIALLEAIESKSYDASGGVIRYRGEVVERADLTQLISRVKQERDIALSIIEDHDRRCRSVHDVAARTVWKGWREYLKSLTQLLHYVEHSEADLSDAHGQLANVTMMATASGRVSARKIKRILNAGNDLQGVMAKLDQQTTEVDLPQSVLKELEVESWRKAFEELKLPMADEHNIGQWMEAVDSWAIPMIAAFSALRTAVLEELLKAEKIVAEAYLESQDAESAPKPANVPKEYATRPRGSERIRQKKLDWWSRFTLADGIGPSIGRFAVASSIVAAVVIAGVLVGDSTVMVYNGLSTPVSVLINDDRVLVGPSQHKSLSVGARRSGSIVTRTQDGRLIESFEGSLDKAFAVYVYNVAQAAPMVEWSQAYGDATQPEPTLLGCPRWRITTAFHIFEDPPEQIKTSGSGELRSVLSSNADMHPVQILQLIENPQEKKHVILAHAKWDSTTSRYISSWLARAGQYEEIADILSQRLKANPIDVPTLRHQQDSASPEEKNELLKHHRELARKHPDDPDWNYIGIRAMPDGPEQDRAYLESIQKWPDNTWLNYAAAYAYVRSADWQNALSCYDISLGQLGPLFDPTAIHVARIRRLVAGEKKPQLGDLQSAFELQQMLELESGKHLKGQPLYAYSLLNQGQTDEAYRAAGGDKADNRILVLLAASQGAKKEWRQRALQLQIEDIQDPRLFLYLVALAFRSGQTSDPYLEKLDEFYPDDQKSPVDVIKKFIEQGAPDESLESELIGLDPQGRGLALATAIVMFPDHANDKWRKEARALLFSAERPAF